MNAVVTGLRAWPARRWAVALALTVIFAGVAGGITDLIPNPLSYREIAPAWWSYPILLATSVLGGLVLASYVRSPAQPSAEGKMAGGGLLSVLAIGCPVCNKLVVLALGTSGALTWWAPLQPIVGLASVGVLGWALWTRLSAEGSCKL